jgi:mono/diheme cytochrome c family protein
MSTSLSVILRRLAVLAAAGAVALVIMLIFSYDVIKVDWLSFMEVQPSFQPMEHPQPVPALSIPVEGPAYVSNLGPPANPVAADPSSMARGAELFNINCTACHGSDGKGTGPVAPFLQNKKPVDLTGPIASSLSDGGIFMIISNGTPGGMPALNENLTVRERWDVVNYVRTLQQK